MYKPLLLAALAVVIAGCGLFPADMTHSRAVRDAGWRLGAIYFLAQPGFLLYSKQENRYWVSRSNANHGPKNLGLACGGFYSLPESLADYYAAPAKWPSIQKVLPIGSRVRFELAYRHGFPYGYELAGRAIQGTLLEDEQSLAVYLMCLSIPDAHNNQYIRDDAWLTTQPSSVDQQPNLAR